MSEPFLTRLTYTHRELYEQWLSTESSVRRNMPEGSYQLASVPQLD